MSAGHNHQKATRDSGIFLPEFVKKNVNIWFAIDNIDLLEDTPTGQNTFHGTVIIINQRSANGEPVNKPDEIPEKLIIGPPLQFKINYLQEPVIKTSPMHFENFILNKRIDLALKDFTRIWALANHATCTNDAVDHQLTNNVDQNELNQERNEQELQLPQTTTQDTGESTDLLYT